MQMQPIPGSQIPNQSGTAQSTPQSQQSSTGYGVAAFICGLLSLFIPIAGILLGIAAIVLYIKQKNSAGTTGLATAGLVMGIIGLLMLPLMFIGALSYFGALDPSRFIPDKCVFSAGFGSCLEAAAVGNDIKFKLINSVGQPITITQLSAQVKNAPCTATVTTDEMSWSSGAIKIFTISGCTPKSGEQFDSAVTITYTPQEGAQPRIAQGEVSIMPQ